MTYHHRPLLPGSSPTYPSVHWPTQPLLHSITLAGREDVFLAPLCL